MAATSLFWYDLETTGRDPARDRILQFAGQRTDLNFNPIGEPHNILCKPPRDALPDPDAIALTGISVDECETDGLLEFEFAHRILDILNEPDTCILGYNSLRFDDEFLRNLFYRNLIDPYAREWRDGRSRWDLIDAVRLCRALRPDGISWPVNDDGKPNNRLEHLTTANGLSHTAAHDALSDVTATVAVANLLRAHQPKLYNYAFEHRDKASTGNLLNPNNPVPVLHISGMYGAARHYTAVVLPIAPHPLNKNGVLVADLSSVADPFKMLDQAELRRRWFGSREELGELHRLPVKTVHLNRCPVLAPLSVLKSSDADRLNIDTEKLNHNAAGWLDARLHNTLTDILLKPAFDAPADPELQLYSGGFFSPSDRRLMDGIARMPASALAEFDSNAFEDGRLHTLLDRLRARNWPETLTDDECREWEYWVRSAIEDPSLRHTNSDMFRESVTRIRATSPEKAQLMDQLMNRYGRLLS